MPWTETASETFVARHDERDAVDAERVLAQLEYGRERLERVLEVELGELAVVLHGSPAQLDAAQPWLALQRRLTAPAARRYVVGWAGERELPFEGTPVLSDEEFERASEEIAGLAQGDGALAYA